MIEIVNTVPFSEGRVEHIHMIKPQGWIVSVIYTNFSDVTNGNLLIVDPKTGRVIVREPLHNRQINDLCVSPDGQYIFIGTKSIPEAFHIATQQWKSGSADGRNLPSIMNYFIPPHGEEIYAFHWLGTQTCWDLKNLTLKWVSKVFGYKLILIKH